MTKWLDQYLEEIALSVTDKADKKDNFSELSVLSVAETCVSRIFFSDLADKHEFNELFEERAAIMEFDGGLSKEEAEGLARIDIEEYRMEEDHE